MLKLKLIFPQKQYLVPIHLKNELKLRQSLDPLIGRYSEHFAKISWGLGNHQEYFLQLVMRIVPLDPGLQHPKFLRICSQHPTDDVQSQNVVHNKQRDCPCRVKIS